jgi:hypothetical protein
MERYLAIKGGYALTQKEQRLSCISVFKNGENTTSKTEFTRKWIELITKLEKSKMITTVGSNDKPFSM